MNTFRQMNPVPQETRDAVKAIFEEWKKNQVDKSPYIDDNLDEDEEDDGDEEQEESYCPACGFPNCSGFCL